MRMAAHALFLTVIWIGVIVFIGIPVGQVIFAMTLGLFSTVTQ